MARALSDDLRLRVLKASAAGMSARQAAVRFGVGISTAIRWIARAREGEPTSRPQGWRRPSILDAQEAGEQAFAANVLESDTQSTNAGEKVDKAEPGSVFRPPVALRHQPEHVERQR